MYWHCRECQEDAARHARLLWRTDSLRWYQKARCLERAKVAWEALRDANGCSTGKWRRRYLLRPWEQLGPDDYLAGKMPQPY